MKNLSNLLAIKVFCNKKTVGYINSINLNERLGFSPYGELHQISLDEYEVFDDNNNQINLIDIVIEDFTQDFKIITTLKNVKLEKECFEYGKLEPGKMGLKLKDSISFVCQEINSVIQS